MNTDDRLNLRARQILDDPTLSQNQRIQNPSALLKELARSVRQNEGRLEAILSQIADDDVREKMRVALMDVML